MILPPLAMTAFAIAIGAAIPHDTGLRAVILITALLLDAVLGELASLWRRLPHPVVIFGHAISAIEKRFNRRNVRGRSRRRRGVAAIILLVLAALLSGGVIMVLAGAGGFVATVTVELIFVTVLLAGRSLDDHVRAVATALDGGTIGDARAAVSMIVGRNPESLDPPAIARAAIETTAENLSDGVIAPALFYLALGLPGIIAYKMINTADSMTGYKSKRYYAWGWGAARLDDLINLIPARLTGLLLALAQPANMIYALRVMWRDADRHRSPNAGWPEAAMAAQLGLALAGPRRYGERMSTDAPMHGESRCEATAADIRKGLGLMWRTIGLFAVLLGGVGLTGF
jgi:adenosylcobinamide-phosphate synthase